MNLETSLLRKIDPSRSSSKTFHRNHTFMYNIEASPIPMVPALALEQGTNERLVGILKRGRSNKKSRFG
jgi:hypothetical protein